MVAPELRRADPARPFLLMLIIEVSIGLMLGLAIRLMVIALQLAGSIAAQSTALAQMFGAGVAPDPMPAIGNVLMLAGITLAVASGLHVKAAVAMARSYEILPMGLPVPASDVAAWGTARVAQAFALGFSLAAPFVIAAFAYNLALGAINRAMPSADGRLHRRAGDHRRRPPAPDARRAGDAALLGPPPRPRRSPTPWRCRDERGRRQRRREGLRPDAAAARRGAPQGRHPALDRRHRRRHLPRAPRRRRHGRRLRPAAAPARC